MNTYDYYEKLYGKYRLQSDEKLIEVRNELFEDYNYLLSLVKDKSVNSNQKSEILDTDLKYDKEQIEYIDFLLNERNNKRSIRK